MKKDLNYYLWFIDNWMWKHLDIHAIRLFRWVGYVFVLYGIFTFDSRWAMFGTTLWLSWSVYQFLVVQQKLASLHEEEIKKSIKKKL